MICEDEGKNVSPTSSGDRTTTAAVTVYISTCTGHRTFHHLTSGLHLARAFNPCGMGNSQSLPDEEANRDVHTYVRRVRDLKLG